jgi:hypothetical protein
VALLRREAGVCLSLAGGFRRSYAVPTISVHLAISESIRSKNVTGARNCALWTEHTFGRAARCVRVEVLSIVFGSHHILLKNGPVGTVWTDILRCSVQISIKSPTSGVLIFHDLHLKLTTIAPAKLPRN